MPTPQLVAAANRTSTEADIRALALAKVKTFKAYESVLYASTKEMTDEQLVDRELELSAARKAMYAAANAFDKAV